MARWGLCSTCRVPLGPGRQGGLREWSAWLCRREAERCRSRGWNPRAPFQRRAVGPEPHRSEQQWAILKSILVSRPCQESRLCGGVSVIWVQMQCHCTDITITLSTDTQKRTRCRDLLGHGDASCASQSPCSSEFPQFPSLLRPLDSRSPGPCTQTPSAGTGLRA